MTLYIDADHNGYELKHELSDYLRRSGYEVIDVGFPNQDPEDDYPLAASRVVHAMRSSHDHQAQGILICGSGQGVCIAANRFKGIRASLAWDNREAKAARNDDDSNILCLPARMLTATKAKSITHMFLSTPFAGAPRYKRRIEQLDELS
jgi:ribose 5-phosphate isomerase B